MPEPIKFDLTIEEEAYLLKELSDFSGGLFFLVLKTWQSLLSKLLEASRF